MSREAIKLALEALQTLHDENMDYLTRNKLGGENNQCMVFAREAITALREALAKPDFWEGYVPEPVKPATTETNGGKTGWPPGLLQDDCKGLSKWLSNKPDAKRRVREALDKMAENARELGLDYEPVCNKDPQGCWNVRCQLGKKCKNTSAQQEYASFAEWAHDYVQDNLHKLKPAQRTWVGLVWGELPEDGQNHDFLRGAVWAETKLKEKNQ